MGFTHIQKEEHTQGVYTRKKKSWKSSQNSVYQVPLLWSPKHFCLPQHFPNCISSPLPDVESCEGRDHVTVVFVFSAHNSKLGIRQMFTTGFQVFMQYICISQTFSISENRTSTNLDKNLIQDLRKDATNPIISKVKKG